MTIGERLFEFDRNLCGYAVGNIRQYLPEAPRRPRPGGPVRPQQWESLDFHVAFSYWFRADDTGLADYVWPCDSEERMRLPLSDAEFDALESALHELPLRAVRVCTWQPYPVLHARYIDCLPEIRSGLSAQTAEEWAASSAKFAAHLCAEQLLLADGVAVTHEWVTLARGYLRALDAIHLLPAPLGTHATPTISHPRMPRRAGVSGRDARSVPTVQGRGSLSSSPVCGWKEAIALTGLRKTKLYDLFHRGVLRGYRDGTMIRFYRASLVAYMAAHENSPAAPLPALRPMRKGKRRSATNAMRFKFL